MLNDRIVAYLSLIFSVVGFGLVVYQSHEVKKLNEYEAIRQIQISEPSFTITDFKRWEQEGKLGSYKIEIFKRFVINANIDPVNNSV
ncbi:hypothetical protein PCIT_a2148 [Pseudoalteromonas citrea]|uniref:Uncharacterized protein n=2 Tax=Pseudoalteromonas citrea TaxID=43655 RepID=A0AAD4AJB5_9GAMM|nr:hypothetical protein [Pseudoalteromonas citrea]KAF7772138.1 hypothetical protein PCIT_a2148 [Pseudoalteromonas citrea]